MTIILDKSSRSLAATAASTVNEERRRGKTMERSQSDAVLYWSLTTELTMVSFAYHGEILAWVTNLNRSSLFSSTCQGSISGNRRSAYERTSCCSGALEWKWAASFWQVAGTVRKFTLKGVPGKKVLDFIYSKCHLLIGSLEWLSSHECTTTTHLPVLRPSMWMKVTLTLEPLAHS